jgi:hypothetical protein
MNANVNINTFADSHIVFEFSFHGWGASKTDKSVTAEVTASKNASKRAGRFSKNLLGDDPMMGAINSGRAEFRNWCNANLQPFGKGAYLVPMTAFIQFKQQRLDPFLVEDSKRCDTFVQHYPTLISKAAFTQGDMFDRSDYPSAEEVRSKYEIRVFTYPVPKDNFFVQSANNYASEAIESLRATFTSETERRVGEAMAFAWEKLHESLEWAAKACEEREMGEDGKLRRKPIHETSVAKLIALTRTLSDFNLTGDPKLEVARVALENALTGMTVPALTDALKESPDTRADIKAKIASVRSLLEM